MIPFCRWLMTPASSSSLQDRRAGVGTGAASAAASSSRAAARNARAARGSYRGVSSGATYPLRTFFSLRHEPSARCVAGMTTSPLGLTTAPCGRRDDMFSAVRRRRGAAAVRVSLAAGFAEPIRGLRGSEANGIRLPARA